MKSLLDKSNKKGIVPLAATAILAIGLIIFVAILLAFFVFSAKYRYIIIGTTILFSVIYLMGKAMMSESGFNKNKTIVIVILLGVGLFFIFGSNVLQTTFTGTPEVYYPQYGNLKCSLAASDYELYEQTALTSSKSFTCGVGMNAYTNFCRFQIRMKGTNWASWFTNVKFEKCNSANKCMPISGITPINDYFTVYEINLDANRDGYLDSLDGEVYSTVKITPSTGWFSSTQYDIRVLGNAYFLEDTQGNNFRTTYEQGCDLNDISQVHPIKKETQVNFQNSASQIGFGRSVNYVWGMTKGITSNTIYKNSKWIYVQEPGRYYNILTTSDGYTYVDHQNPVLDASIECAPSNIYTCNADATIRKAPSTNVEGQDCSLIRGVSPNEFLKASNGQCCKFSCVNNKIATNDCQTCATCATGLIYNAQTNTCVNPTDTSIPPTNQAPDLTCEFWENKVLYSQVEYKWYNYLGIGQPIESTQAKCVTSGATYLVISLIGITILIIIILILNKPTKKKGGAKR